VAGDELVVDAAGLGKRRRGQSKSK
jgi:hypothetical protein